MLQETKTWILRCYACFHTTPLMEKVFCPKCGNKTLKRVSVTLNRDGTQQIHISMRRPLNRYGTAAYLSVSYLKKRVKVHD
jgi:RNA-binding protein NOB1